MTHQHSTPTSQLRTHTCPRNALNLHRHTFRQLLNRDTAPRRLVRKVLLKDAVHLGKVGHVVEKHVDFDDALNLDASFGQDADNVLAALLGLVGDAAFDQVALCVGGDLARDVDLWASDDGLRLGWLALVVRVYLLCSLSLSFAGMCVAFGL